MDCRVQIRECDEAIRCEAAPFDAVWDGAAAAQPASPAVRLNSTDQLARRGLGSAALAVAQCSMRPKKNRYGFWLMRVIGDQSERLTFITPDPTSLLAATAAVGNQPRCEFALFSATVERCERTRTRLASTVWHLDAPGIDRPWQIQNTPAEIQRHAEQPEK